MALAFQDILLKEMIEPINKLSFGQAHHAEISIKKRFDAIRRWTLGRMTEAIQFNVHH